MSASAFVSASSSRVWLFVLAAVASILRSAPSTAAGGGAVLAAASSAATAAAASDNHAVDDRDVDTGGVTEGFLPTTAGGDGDDAFMPPTSALSWMSSSDGRTEYARPVHDKDRLGPLAERHWRGLTGGGGSGNGNSHGHQGMFADGSETYYDEYAQAWRALGFYVDCDYPNDDAGDATATIVVDYADYVAAANNNHNGNNNKNNNNNNQGSSSTTSNASIVCRRYLLWAAVSAGGNLGEIREILFSTQCRLARVAAVPLCLTMLLQNFTFVSSCHLELLHVTSFG
jgi:hypothetical protein